MRKKMYDQTYAILVSDSKNPVRRVDGYAIELHHQLPRLRVVSAVGDPLHLHQVAIHAVGPAEGAIVTGRDRGDRSGERSQWRGYHFTQLLDPILE